MATPLVTKLQDGGTPAIDYTPAVAVVGGDVVVQSELVGIAVLDIAADKLGAIDISGLFKFPKAAGSGTAIAAGDLCYWDATAEEAEEDAAGGTNKFVGMAQAAAANAATSVNILLGQQGEN